MSNERIGLADVKNDESEAERVAKYNARFDSINKVVDLIKSHGIERYHIETSDPELFRVILPEPPTKKFESAFKATNFGQFKYQLDAPEAIEPEKQKSKKVKK